ncbi:uncharacterized protein LOC132746964 [Ruditapes philippinarum]|uniref:uncharacterized protein LOC132746964 n=1 Tax=Ruditapes philippinarum TaxID=129788 RepID=UPI00295B226F|nr:uncharacterized protein LOC132746964 [Ruditapes philippinarum]
MFTIVNYPQVHYHRRDASEPRPEIINHRNDPDSKRWSEKLRNEETTYKHLKQHRDELLESEIRYKKTIKQLEKEKAELIKIYEPTYDENKVLKSIIEHGPDAVKMKKLRKARKELGEEVDTLKDENKRLTEQMQELIKKNEPMRDNLLEKNWHDVLSESKKTKENETVVAQGPFPAKDNEKGKKVPEKKNMKEDDEYDLQLDTVEKEIQILLNNVKYIKKQKEKLDYAILMSKGAIVRNSVLEKAIYDKLDEDLTKFKTELDIAKSKHDDIKEQIEQKEEDKAKLKTDPVINSDNKTGSEKTMVLDQPETYTTRETQTETLTEQKPVETDQHKVKKKRTIKSNSNIAVQTDFPNVLDLKSINQEAMKYIEQYEIKKSKIHEAKFSMSEKVSSTQTRKNYAKKLVVRRQESPMMDRTSNDSMKQINKVFLNRVDQPRKKVQMPTNAQKRMDEALYAREEENVDIVDRSANKEKKRSKSLAATGGDSANRVVKQINSQGKIKDKQQLPTKDVSHTEETVPMKSNQKLSKMNRNTHVEHLPRLRNTNMSYAQSNFQKSKIEPKSVDQLKREQDIYDYENMIMNPKANVANPAGRLQKPKLDRNRLGNIKQSRFKSKSSLDINQASTHSRASARKHRLPVTLPPIDRISIRSGSVDSWKSESDLPVFSESETGSIKPIKDFKLVIKKKKNLMHLRGVLDGEVIEKRDESAYDEVLHDLHNQQKQSARDVYQEFNNTVHNFRDKKYNANEKQKHTKKRHEPPSDIIEQAPLTFIERPSLEREL